LARTSAMPKLGVSGITIDARDPGVLAAWWGEALGWTTTGRVCHPPAGAGYRIEFMPVDDAKQIKNRVHIDLAANEVQTEVDRLIGMGATLAWEEEFPEELGYRNVVLRDPEGNEFCVGGPPAAEPHAD
jgi:predicted enzyme related to lactoylglutathione lyase